MKHEPLQPKIRFHVYDAPPSSKKPLVLDDPRKWSGYHAIEGDYFRDKGSNKIFQQIGVVHSEDRPSVYVFRYVLTDEVFWVRGNTQRSAQLYKDVTRLSEMEVLAWMSV